MEGDGLVHLAFACLARVAGRDAAGQVGRVGTEARVGRLNDDELLHLRPACFRMLLASRTFATGSLAAGKLNGYAVEMHPLSRIIIGHPAFPRLRLAGGSSAR